METPKELNEALHSEEELRIKQKLQNSNFDCGQTCLDMLGYDGHELFPNQEVSSFDLRSIPGAQEVTVPAGQEETLDYTYPHIWILLGKDKVAGAQHWIIRHGDNIYCPTVGTMDAKEYKKKYVAFILQEFVVPFKGQKVPDGYCKKHQGNVIEEDAKTRLPTEMVSERVQELPEISIGQTYVLSGRKIRYTGDRTLSNGIKQFQVEYLDDPNDGSEGKKGEKEWHGDWQIKRLSKLEE